MTAVEWLEKRLLGIVFLDTEYSTIEYKKRIDKAKEMEKQQKGYSEENMREAFEVGFIIGYKDDESNDSLTFEEWFKQFKNK